MSALAITGIGLFTPAGDGTDATWERVLKGLSAATLTQVDGREYLTCPAPPFAPERLGAARFRRRDRSAQFAHLAVVEAVRDAGLSAASGHIAVRGAGLSAAPGHIAIPDAGLSAAPSHTALQTPEFTLDPDRTAVLVGTGAGCVTAYDSHHETLRTAGADRVSPFAVPSSLPNSIAAQLSITLGAGGPSTTVNTACASGASALGLAADLLRLGRCDTAVVVGAEAILTPFHLAGFDRIGALSHRCEDPAAASRPFDAGRDGFVAAEGAGALVLERVDHAAARGARVHARLLGHGSSSDAHNAVRPRADGHGIATAVRAALTDAGITAADIGYVNAHATGTPLGDTVEAQALARLLPHRPPVSSTKGVTGHLFGAAGTVEAALTALALGHGLLPPNTNLDRPSPDIDLDLPTAPRPHTARAALSVSAGFGGHNAVLVLAPA
ncbi:beta-ketoacyl-[acyl-carrier-protein] synthase family protein [Streptomyces acidiscabies]|uniref:beta-ketoacyl-[acyl-carrier-protein] synthase family protein n=1 Tax=Streptomyces acidiscabies TaxID=42234 RepID=UPI00095252C8|nr:beta-ketoacyl-[acyl-carrier-protein] synthase family protein [Streptomyces acidiscabies]